MKNETSKQRAYDLIINDIIRGAFQGETVLNERRLIERYEIGKTPIREALVELCNEKVLRSIPRYGYEILTLTHQDINDVLQFRCMMECACLREAAPKLSAEAVESYRAFARAEDDLEVADVWEAWESNVRVHLKLMSFCENRYCGEMLKQSMGILKRAYAQFYWEKWRDVKRKFGHDIHQQIADALQAGDVDTACRLLAEDINSFEKLIFTY